MLPASYATPAAVILALGGLLSCFAGYRLFRIVLGINGFILGALVTTSLMGTSHTWTLVMAAIVGGVIGALLMVVAYFMGVGLVGAGLTALAVNVLWRFIGGEPPTWLLVVLCVIGALAALSAARFVIIFGTAIAGAWTLVVGALALWGDPGALSAASAGNVWVLYPFGPVFGHWWPALVWFGLALAGALVQLATTRRGRRRKRAAA